MTQLLAAAILLLVFCLTPKLTPNLTPPYASLRQGYRHHANDSYAFTTWHTYLNADQGLTKPALLTQEQNPMQGFFAKLSYAFV